MSGCPSSRMWCPRVAVWVNDSAAGRLGGRRVGGEESGDAGARGPARTYFRGLVHVNARDRSRVGRELALRPGFSTEAWMPPTARSAPRGVRRGLLVLTAGLVPYFYWRYPTGPVVASQSARWSRPNLIERAGVPALFLPRGPDRGTEGLKTMTLRRQDLAARRRGELNRDHGSRRVSSAIEAQRRLNSRRADGGRTRADPLGPSDPRYAYLTRTHD